MKRRLPVILAIVLALVLALPIVASAKGQVAEKEVDQARRVAQAWVDRFAVTGPKLSEWDGAHLTSPQLYYNPKGELTAYMFSIEKNGKTVGHILVGSSAYGYPIFEGGETFPFSVPSASEVSGILEKELGLQIPEESIGEPMLLLLDLFQGFYVTYKLEGKIVGINLITGDVFKASNLEELKTLVPSPEEYKAAKRGRVGILACPGWGEIYHADDMEYYCENNRCWCGPCSGVSIGAWYRDYGGHGGLHQDKDTMYDRLKIYMGTTSEGITWPWNYGPGFVNYAYYDCGEFFNWDYRYTFGNIVFDINNNWPVALCGALYEPGYGKKKWHWVAIKAYWWCDPDRLIFCTDSAAEQNWRCFDWDAIEDDVVALIRIQG